MSWFRMHTEILHHRVVATLPADLFKAWVKILCLAKLGDGVVPDVHEIAFQLRCGLSSAERWTSELVNDYNLLESNGDGTFRPKNWNRHQYVSDVSTNRVQRFRERKGNVSRNGDETQVKLPQSQRQSTETEQSQNRPPLAANSTPTKPIGITVSVLTMEEFTFAWDRHHKRKNAEPLNFGAQMVSQFTDSEAMRFRDRHGGYCDYWDKHGWNNDFGACLTFCGWLQNGMPAPPPEAKTETDWMADI